VDERLTAASLLTPQEVADLLQVRRSWVYDAARRDVIPHVRLGRYVRFRKESLEAWLAEQERQPDRWSR
jgi:excisionase family DNA binding protein